MKKLIATLFFFTALQTSTAQAGSFDALPLLPGAISSQVYGISADGKYIVGTNGDGTIFEAFVWTSATGTVGIGDLPNGTFNSTGRGISDDGNVIVGRGNGINGSEAFIWKRGIGMVGLGDLAGGIFSSQALGVSADGTVVVGTGTNATTTEVWRWTALGGMVGLGTLGGAGFSNYGDMTPDGNVIVGSSRNASNNTEAFRWVNGVGMSGLGDFTGGLFNSAAYGVSRDGNVVVGYGTSAAGSEAFRWTQATGMVPLGDLPGGAVNSSANMTNFDGSIIVGNGTTALGPEGFYWTQAGGMRLLTDVMTDAGANLTGWNTVIANALSDDGNIMIGRGQYGGTTRGFIMNFLDAAMADPIEISKSLNTVAQAGQQTAMSAMNYMPQGLFAAQNLASISTPISTSSYYVASATPTDLPDITPAAGGNYIAGGASELSFFMLGSFGAGQNNNFKNDQLSGTAGLTVSVADGLELGVGVITGTSNTDLDFGGESRMDALGGMALISYAPSSSGFRLYGTAYAAHLSMDIERGYFNNGVPDRSNGETEGVSFGGALKLGWQADLSDRTSATPYIEGRYARTKIDAYREKGGGFAAKFSEQENDYATSRLGLEIKHRVNNTLEIMARPAWGHRITDDGSAFTADINGLGQNLSWNAGDRDWAEATIGATWRTTDNASFSTEVTGRSGDTAEPALNIIIGTSIRF